MTFVTVLNERRRRMIHTPGRTEVCVHLECEYLSKPFAPEALIAKIESARRVVGGATVAVAG
jgi:hypothetical protein